MRTIDQTPGEFRWLSALREPAQVLHWSLGEWDHAIRLSRRLRLLGRLAEAVACSVGMTGLPEPVARQLQAEINFSRWRTRTLCWALEHVATAWADAPYPRVLLKGAAYIAQDLTIARGRLPSDIDVLVPRDRIADAQSRLVAAGWREVALDAHDRHYYHELSHEAPPMRHPRHGLELDLHHNILPPVARTHVDAALLLERVQASPWPGWHVLHPVDQVLHCAAHLFQDSELTDRLRDLVDLDELLRCHGSNASFWQQLPSRARQIGLGVPLALGCHFATHWFKTPMPAEAGESLNAMLPGRLQRAWLFPALEATLRPTAPDDRPSAAQRLGALALLARYHTTRMPLRHLLPHLWHKARPGRKAAHQDQVVELPGARLTEAARTVQSTAKREAQTL